MGFTKIISFLFFLLTVTSCGTAKLSVMSFNVRQSHAKEVNPNDSWSNRKDACLEMLKTTKPDLVGFQEAQFKGQWSFFRDSLSAAYGSIGVGRKDGKEKDECMGILYRRSLLTLVDSGTFWLSETPDTPSNGFNEKYARTATWAILKLNKSGKKFLYVNTHLGLSNEARSKGLALIRERIKVINPENLPVILAGDMNTTPSNKVFRELRTEMKSASEIAPVTDDTKTYNAWGNEKKAAVIDYIWITDGIKCLEYHTDTAAYGGHQLISDHYPIIAILKI